jgi:micrococcal nuclease
MTDNGGKVVKLTQLALWLVTSILILSLTGCHILFGSAPYSVKRVSDGDTLTVVDARGSDIRVRFACVDAPEIPHSAKERATKKPVSVDQFKWGIEAQERLQQLLTQGGDRVGLTITDSDRYGRQVGEVRLRDGRLIQEILAQEGLALVYEPYLKNCPSAALVKQAQAQAQKQHRGVWSDAKFVAPWKFRQRT